MTTVCLAPTRLDRDEVRPLTETTFAAKRLCASRVKNTRPRRPKGHRRDRQYFLPAVVTVRRVRPLRRRFDSTRRPFAVAMRARNPWVRRRFKLLGW